MTDDTPSGPKLHFGGLPDPVDGAKLTAPAAARNRDAILAVLARHAPKQGYALELASGTGEHILAFAAAHPGLIWQPSDPDPARRASIAAWTAEAGGTNIRPPLALDIGVRGWGAAHRGHDLIVAVNLLHLVRSEQAETAATEIADALNPDGTLCIYGPFLRDGATTSDGDASFHATLQASDPAIGYKDVAWVISTLEATGLDHVDTVEMPANNLMLIAHHPGTATD